MKMIDQNYKFNRQNKHTIEKINESEMDDTWKNLLCETDQRNEIKAFYYYICAVEKF